MAYGIVYCAKNVHNNRKRGDKAWERYNILEPLYYKIIAKKIWR